MIRLVRGVLSHLLLSSRIAGIGGWPPRYVVALASGAGRHCRLEAYSTHRQTNSGAWFSSMTSLVSVCEWLSGWRCVFVISAPFSRVLGSPNLHMRCHWRNFHAAAVVANAPEKCPKWPSNLCGPLALFVRLSILLPDLLHRQTSGPCLSRNTHSSYSSPAIAVIWLEKPNVSTIIVGVDFC